MSVVICQLPELRKPQVRSPVGLHLHAALGVLPLPELQLGGLEELLRLQVELVELPDGHLAAPRIRGRDADGRPPRLDLLPVAAALLPGQLPEVEDLAQPRHHEAPQGVQEAAEVRAGALLGHEGEDELVAPEAEGNAEGLALLAVPCLGIFPLILTALNRDYPKP